jgi:hypothetical protein
MNALVSVLGIAESLGSRKHPVQAQFDAFRRAAEKMVFYVCGCVHTMSLLVRGTNLPALPLRQVSLSKLSKRQKIIVQKAKRD